jgi:multidrug efflux pump subunit AcrA (membrane-fusion protein)
MAPKAIVIRDASISTDQLGRYVYLVNDSNQVVYTPIEVGPLYRDTLRIVTKGLSPTDRYVTTALLKVRDGMPVVPVLK